jgi:hypothetical protein
MNNKGTNKWLCIMIYLIVLLSLSRGDGSTMVKHVHLNNKKSLVYVHHSANEFVCLELDLHEDFTFWWSYQIPHLQFKNQNQNVVSNK